MRETGEATERFLRSMAAGDASAKKELEEAAAAALASVTSPCNAADPGSMAALAGNLLQGAHSLSRQLQGLVAALRSAAGGSERLLVLIDEAYCTAFSVQVLHFPGDVVLTKCGCVSLCMMSDQTHPALTHFVITASQSLISCFTCPCSPSAQGPSWQQWQHPTWQQWQPPPPAWAAAPP